MTSLLKRKVTFRERATEFGLTADEVNALADQGLTCLSASAFSAAAPGNPRQDSPPDATDARRSHFS